MILPTMRSAISSRKLPAEVNMVWKYLLPAMKDEPLPGNARAAKKLKQRLESLALPLVVRGPDSPLAATLSSKTFILENNEPHVDSLAFDFTGEICNLIVKANNKTYNISFGAGKWILSETDLPGPNILSRPGALAANKIAGSYSWKNNNTLELVLRYIESPHTMRFTCIFENDELTANIHLSIPPGQYLEPLKGKVIR